MKWPPLLQPYAKEIAETKKPSLIIHGKVRNTKPSQALAGRAGDAGLVAIWAPWFTQLQL